MNSCEWEKSRILKCIVAMSVSATADFPLLAYSLKSSEIFLFASSLTWSGVGVCADSQGPSNSSTSKSLLESFK